MKTLIGSSSVIDQKFTKQHAAADKDPDSLALASEADKAQ